jgi:hypothetical protein
MGIGSFYSRVRRAMDGTDSARLRALANALRGRAERRMHMVGSNGCSGSVSRLRGAAVAHLAELSWRRGAVMR